MWSSQIEVRHGGTRKTPKALVQWATHYLTEYSVTTETTTVTPKVSNVMWTPPPPSLFKINVDGALSKISSLVGIGVSIWDDAG